MSDNSDKASGSRLKLEDILEALLFVAEEPIAPEEIGTITGQDLSQIKKTLKGMSETRKEEKHPIQIEQIAGGWRMFTSSEVSEYVQKYTGEQNKKRLSGASLETLSIIAYKQPITRQEIEYIRGVNVDGALRSLVERGFVKIAGRKDVPGRPLLYGTTKLFLDHFGLGGLKDLPRLAEFSENDLELPDSMSNPDLKNEGEQEDMHTAEESGVVPEVAESTDSPEEQIRETASE